MPTLERNQPVPGEFYLLMPDTTRREEGMALRSRMRTHC